MYHPLEKGVAFHLNKLEILPLKDACAKFGWNWRNGYGEKDEKERRTQTDGRTTDVRLTEKFTGAFS